MRADALLTADWHLRETPPVCRTDDFLAAMWRKVAFVKKVQQDNGNIPIINAGDLTHHWKNSPWLISQMIIKLPQMHVVYGQHDLPQHSLKNAHKSSVYALACAKAIEILEGVHFGQLPEDCSGHHFPPLHDKKKFVLVWHNLVWDGVRPWPTCTAPSAREVLDKYSNYDLIVTGDNHKPCVHKYNGRLLVNPGSLMRQHADQADYKPRVYLWYKRKNHVEPVYLPIEEGVVTREHIAGKEERDERIDAFISRLNTEWDVGLDFERNIERFVSENHIRKSVVNIIKRAIGG